jgi:hypothetical protein
VKYSFLIFLALLALPEKSEFVPGKVDEAATLSGRTCPLVTQLSLSRDVKIEDRHGDSYAVDLWISGEFIRDTRVVLSEKKGVIKAEVIQAKRKSVCSQLKKLYSSRPSLTPEEASQLISLKMKEYYETKLPQLRVLFEEVRNLRFSAKLSDSIFFPSRGITLRLTNGIEKSVVTFVQPEPSADRVTFWGDSAVSQPQAADWVEKLLTLLKLPGK